MLGHTAGDELMVQAARRFEKSTSKFEGVLARWGGDQFALLIPDVASADAALDIAGLLQEQLRAPFELRRHRLVVAATVGVTCADSGQQRAEDVVREADIALSVAKRQETAKDRRVCAEHGGTGGESREPGGGPARRHRKARAAIGCFSRSSICEPTRWWAPRRCCAGATRWRVCSRRSDSCASRRKSGLMVPITRWIILQGDQARGGLAAASARQSEFLHQHQSFRRPRCAIRI